MNKKIINQFYLVSSIAMWIAMFLSIVYVIFFGYPF